MIQRYILNASGKLNGLSRLIEQTVQLHTDRIAVMLGISDLDIVISHFPDLTHPVIGIGGNAYDSHRLDIYLNADNENIANSINEELLNVLSHEMHHCRRIGKVGHPKTLLDHLVIEGLACHFEEIVNNGKDNSLFAELKNQDWNLLFLKYKPLLMDDKFDFKYWFLGSSPNELPKYSGYFVGYKLVTGFMAANKLTWNTVIDKDVGDFVRT